MPLREQLSAAPCRNGLVARIDGHGGWLSSTVLMGLADGLPADGTLFVDLEECSHIDSSFVGALVRLHHHFEHGPPRRLLICGIPESCGRVFRTMHLDGLLKLTTEQPPEVTGAWTEHDLVGEVGDQDTVARHVRACHAALAALPGPHRDACRAVVEQIDRELAGRR